MPSLANYRIYDVAEPCNYQGEKLVEAMKKVIDEKLSGNGREFNLHGCCVGPAGLACILENWSDQLVKIKRLNLGGNKIGDEGAALLAQSECFSKLQWLELGGNDINAEGIKALIKSPVLKKLKTLNLYRNWLKDEGAKFIASENELEKLEEMDLAQNEICDEGVIALSVSKKLPNIVAMTLDNNFFTREGREEARLGSTFKRLKALNL